MSDSVRIEDLPADQRPRERMARLGADALADAEVVALIVGSGFAGDSALSVAQRMLAAHGGAGGLLAATHHSLRAVRGVGEATACRILAAAELQRRAARAARPLTVASSDDIAALVMPELDGRDRERLVVVVLNRALDLVDVVPLGDGFAGHVAAGTADILHAVLTRGGSAFAVAHNHPGGSLEAGADDVAVSSALGEAAAVCGLRFLDHIIVAAGQWRSITR